MTHDKKAAVLTESSLILAAVFWGLNFAATKYAASSVPPLLLVALRFTMGGLLLLFVAMGVDRNLPFGRQAAPQVIILDHASRQTVIPVSRHVGH